MNAKARMANLITGTRILCSNALLFCPAFSPSFVVLYLVSGLTDMVDGAVARKTGTVSAPLVCTVATHAAIQEGHFIRTGKENREKWK